MTPDPERRLICASCGREFGCRRDNVGECWCNAEAYRLPVPVSLPAAGSRADGSPEDCLCPDCLREAASKLKASPGLAGSV